MIKFLDESDHYIYFKSINELNSYLSKFSNFSSKPSTRDEVYKLMDAGGTFFIKFRKVADNSIRYMAATRDWSKLESDPHIDYVRPKGIERVVNPFQVIVWDLEKSAYRSFRISKLISIKKISDGILLDYNPRLRMTRDKFIDLLNNGELTINYTKVDGSSRVMNCTRTRGTYNSDNGDLIKVWDLDKNDYRNIVFSHINKILKKKLSSRYRVNNLFK